MLNGRIKKYLAAAGIIAMLVVVVVPSVAAYEGHKLDVMAYETIPVTKEARLATQDEINAYVHAGLKNSEFNPLTVSVWNSIPKETAVAWVVTIFVKNQLNKTMNNISIYDEFNENVTIAEIDHSQGSVMVRNCNQLDTWQVGTLAPNGAAVLNLIVWTNCYQEAISVRDGDGQSGFNPDTLASPDCDDRRHIEYIWKVKTLHKASDGKYYLQSTGAPGEACGSKQPGINMWWSYDGAGQQKDHYTGGPFLPVIVK